jgi:hypothetical protein
MFVSPRFRDFLGSDPTTAYLNELSAAAIRIDPFAGEGDEPARYEPSRPFMQASGESARESEPVFIPAPVYKSEFIPAPVSQSEFIPATED